MNRPKPDSPICKFPVSNAFDCRIRDASSYIIPLGTVGMEIAALIASQSVKLYVSLKILQKPNFFFIYKLSNFYTLLSTGDVIIRAHFPRAETTFASNLKTPRSTLFQISFHSTVKTSSNGIDNSISSLSRESRRTKKRVLLQ